MKIRFQMVLVLLFVTACALSAQKPAYILYDSSGKEIKYKKMVRASQSADVILFGELHNNPIAHWLQYELTKDLFAEKGSALMLGAEMFEADNQLIMDEYLAGMITREKFEDEMRLWNNYETDYKPLLEFAKDSGLHFVATNIPRRYANVVFKLGIDTLLSLSMDALKFISPLPLVYDTSIRAYADLAGGNPEMGGHGSPNLRDAQAIKDATMTHFILLNWSNGTTFLHFNGAYHSDYYESMYYFLKKANPDLNILTISTVSQDDISKLEEQNEGKADFIICIPETMTKTY